MEDNYYSIHPPDVVRMEHNRAPPSPLASLASAPNTPDGEKSKRSRRSFADSDDDLDIKGPPRVSRQKLPPSMKAPTFSRLPSAVMAPRSGGSNTKKKKSFMKKSEAPFDEPNVPVLNFSSTERTLRMLKGGSAKAELAAPTPPTKLATSRGSVRYKGKARDIKTSASSSTEEAPDDERGARRRNILDEMDAFENQIAANQVATTRTPTAADADAQQVKNAGIPMEISLQTSSVVSDDGEDELMTNPGDELMDRKEKEKQEREKKLGIDPKESKKEDPKESKLPVKNDVLVSDSEDGFELTRSPQSEMSVKIMEATVQAPILGNTRPQVVAAPEKKVITAGERKSLASNISAGAAAMAGGAAVAVAVSEPEPIAMSLSDAEKKVKALEEAKKKVKALEMAKIKSLEETKIRALEEAKKQRDLSKDIVTVQEKTSTEVAVTCNTMMDDAAYFSEAAVNTMAAASEAMEDLGDLVCGSPGRGRSQEVMATEWRRRKQQAADDAEDELVYSTSSPYTHISDQAFVTASEDSDKTALADNRISEMLDLPGLAIAPGDPAPAAAVSPLSPTSSQRSGNMATTANGVTSWRMEKEPAKKKKIHKPWSKSINRIEQNKKASPEPAPPRSPLSAAQRALEESQDSTKKLVVEKSKSGEYSSDEEGNWVPIPPSPTSKVADADAGLEVKTDKPSSPDPDSTDSEKRASSPDSVVDADVVANKDDDMPSKNLGVAMAGAAVGITAAAAATASMSNAPEPTLEAPASGTAKGKDSPKDPPTSKAKAISSSVHVTTRRADPPTASDEKKDDFDEDKMISSPPRPMRVKIKGEEDPVGSSPMRVKIKEDGDHVGSSPMRVKIKEDEDPVGSSPMRVKIMEDGGSVGSSPMRVKIMEDGGSVGSSSPMRVKIKTDEVSVCSAGTEIQSNKAPVVVEPLDDVNGICKGDIILSLVHAKGSEEKGGSSGGTQVRNAIWRSRVMRRRFDLREAGLLISEPLAPRSPGALKRPTLAKSRSSLPVDVDDVRIVGVMNQTRALECNAIDHLRHNEFEEAVELYDDILFVYEECSKREDTKVGNMPLDMNPYLGSVLHNMGIVHLLNDKFEKAIECFESAAEKRESQDGSFSPDVLTSQVKIAICHFALDDFPTAHRKLDECRVMAQKNSDSITDFIQTAEILNNLGCLAFMSQQPGTAMKLFTESLDLQQAVLSHSLYGDSVLASHSTNLNISVTRGNVGFLRMCAKDHASAVLTFETTLSIQQMLLSDAHETLIGTMDHLAVSNLLQGEKEKAVNMLQRMLQAQIERYGADDSRCESTRHKIAMVSEKDHKVQEAVESISRAHAVDVRMLDTKEDLQAVIQPKKLLRVSSRQLSNGTTSSPILSEREGSEGSSPATSPIRKLSRGLSSGSSSSTPSNGKASPTQSSGKSSPTQSSGKSSPTQSSGKSSPRQNGGRALSSRWGPKPSKKEKDELEVSTSSRFEL